jgi:hypothetical protein
MKLFDLLEAMKRLISYLLIATAFLIIYGLGYYVGRRTASVHLAAALQTEVRRDTIREVRVDTIYVPKEIVKYRIVKEPAPSEVPCIERIEAVGSHSIAIETETFEQRPQVAEVYRIQERHVVPLPDRFFIETEVAIPIINQKNWRTGISWRFGRTFHNRRSAAFLVVNGDAALGVGVRLTF